MVEKNTNCCDAYCIFVYEPRDYKLYSIPVIIRTRQVISAALVVRLFQAQEVNR